MANATTPRAGFVMHSDDDIPRTVKRQREAMEREKAAQSAPAPASGAEALAAATASAGEWAGDDHVSDRFADRGEGHGVVVGALRVPFFRLAWFLMKAVLAGIPALLLLMVILWLIGQALTTYFPELIKIRILITFPG